MNAKPVLSLEIPGLTKIASGKVREIFAVGPDSLLLVATDRLSAFDVVMNQGIPDKGRVLTRLAAFWFDQTRDIVANHLITTDDALIAEALVAVGANVDDSVGEMLAGRSMLVRRTDPLPIEAVVRGYVAGSGWKAYQDAPKLSDGTVSLWGVAVPPGLSQSEILPAPIFTPSTKASAGHDEPMLPGDARALLGDYYEPLVSASIALYERGRSVAARAGILLADTKFEFGIAPDNSLMLIDEALTPDSSRFWPEESYSVGISPPSFDKQFVRDYLESVDGWNKRYPAPDLPAEIVEKTAEKYRDAWRKLSGRVW